MTAFVISGYNKVDLKIIIELAKRLGANVKTLSDEEILDIGLLQAMEEGRNSEFISRERIMKLLETNERKDIYKYFPE